jgi:hypothetical protein
VLGEINAVLLAVAIGLTMLDLTCFVTLQALMALSRPESGTVSRTLAGEISNAP